MLRLVAFSLAWQKITHDKARLALSTVGIAFAVVLIFANVGFLHAVYDGQIELLTSLNADLVISSKVRYAMAMAETFPRRRVEQAKAVAGVQAAYPLYVDYERLQWSNPDDGTHQPIRVLAFNPDDPVFLLPEVEQQLPGLKLADTVLLDANSRPIYGRREVGVVTEVSGHSVRVVGMFHLGPDFLSDGNAIMSDLTYLKCRGEPELFLSKVHLGLIKVAPGADPRAVAEELRRVLPDDIKVQTKQEFIEQEEAYWRVISPVGFIFGLGAVLAFVVGMIICYQILYTDITDDLPQFATVKALGYHNSVLVGVVLVEAVLLALMGFLLGFVVSGVVYRGVALLTGLPMRLSAGRIGVVLVLAVVMCVAAGLIALRKVIRADPAEVF